MTNKFRLDIFLVNKNLVESRNKARQLIINSGVLVNGVLITKPNFIVYDIDKIEIIKPLEFVSRGGLKLQKAINEFNISVHNKIILDIGASTGGFTDCCLKNGAKKVYALDVGTGQLHESLLRNPKVIDYSNTNLKEIPKIFKNNDIEIIVVDVSFISLRSVFASIKEIFKPHMQLICLTKPQFELNPLIISKYKGCIKLTKHHNMAIENVKRFANEFGFKLVNIVDSPILGSKGENKEFLTLFELF